MENTMSGFVELVLIMSMIVHTAFAAWLISRCGNLFSGVFVTAVAIAGGYGIYRYALYIALFIIWAFRLATVAAVLAFVFGVFPKPRG